MYANFTASLIEPVGGMRYAPKGEMGRGIALVNAATPGLRAINAHRVWYELGITGAGRLVCGLDTGVMGNHVAFASRWRGTHVPAAHAWKDVLGGGTTFPNDSNGHGTHTMGTMVGLGVATGDTVGVAFGAEWIACNAIDQDVRTEFDNDVIAAFQWIADPDGNPNTTADVPDVVQNSWRINEGFPGGYTDCDPRWWAVIDGVRSGRLCGRVLGGQRRANCSDDRVAARPDHDPDQRLRDRGGGRPARDSVPVPDRRTSRAAVRRAARAPSPRRSSPRWWGRGWTSTRPSIPVVTGLRASAAPRWPARTSRASSPSCAEANPNLSVTTMKQMIMDTARDEGPAGEDNTFGWGMPDAFAAVSAVMQDVGELSGTVVRQGSVAGVAPIPIPGATVTVIGGDRTFTTNTQGTYHGFVPQGTYNITASHPSYQSQTVNGIVIAEGSPAVADFALVPVPDGVAPVIARACPFAADNAVGPYEVSAIVTDNLNRGG